IDVCWKGNMLTSEKLLDLCQRGMDLVKDERHNMYFYFKLHSFTIQKKEDQYFQYVEQKMIPHFRKTGYTMEVEQYEKKLFNHYLKHGKHEKALTLATSIINAKQTYYEEDVHQS